MISLKEPFKNTWTTSNIQAASTLAEHFEAFYPDVQPDGCKTRYFFYSTKQEWFKTAIEILNRPDDGIDRAPIEELNTIYGNEFSPVVSADGYTLYFTGEGRTTGNYGEDIYQSTFDVNNQKWTTPVKVDSLSSETDEAPLSLTSDGNTMLLFRDGKLFTASLTANGWSAPDTMPAHINGFGWVGRATLSASGNTLIFAASSDPEEVYDESNVDLFVSHKIKNRWSKPIEIGSDINTDRQERSPFLHSDGRTLYFSSNGHPSLGGMDVYTSTRLDETWTKWSQPTNMGKEINSLEDDWGYNFSVSPNARKVYLSSDLYESGTSDLFKSSLPIFAQPSPLIAVPGKMLTPQGGILATTIIVKDANTGAVLQEVETQPDGSFTFLAKPGQQLLYHPKEDSSFLNVKRLDLTAMDPKQELDIDTMQYVSIRELLLKRIPVPLKDILFDHDKAELHPSALPELDQLFIFIQNKPWILEIAGHSDDEGEIAYNKELSLQRAFAVKAYLVHKGIPEGRLMAKGYGDEKPIADNETEQGRQKNRRVEISFSVDPLVKKGK